MAGCVSLGVCYYPEHWDRSLWESDLLRMTDVGITTVRIAEFSWSITERTEGNFTFDFFDGFLDLCERVGMNVIMCTPTATPPAWLTEKYPESLNADINGVRYGHGSRRHYNYNSPKYRELSARVVRALAEHYARRRCVIGWQIDNEVNCEADVFYSESDDGAFREFLRARYGTPDELNRAWGCAFWNQTYNSFDEVHVPRPTVNGAHNPHGMADYIRFISDSAISFVKMQADIIREYKKPDDFITTNGMFGHLDNHRMTREALDVFMYDSYPNFAYGTGSHPERGMADRGWSRDLSAVRSISGNFGIMEQQTGANSWNTWGMSPQPKPGQIKLWAMQSAAHGADYISFFRWRTAPFGTEIYWHGILNYDNRDTRRLCEIGEIHKTLSSLSGLAGSAYEARYAVVRDYDNIFDCDVDAWRRALDGESVEGLFRASQHLHAPCDYVYIDDGADVERLLRYRALFYPHAAIMTEARSRLLYEYASRGGVIVFGCRAGYKDENGHCPMRSLPGLVGEWCGADVDDSTAQAGGDAPASVRWGDGKFPAGVYADFVTPKDGAEPLAFYEDAWFAGRCALTRKSVGGGCAYYYGGTFTEPAAREFIARLGLAEPYADTVAVPEQCEIAARGGYLFILNFAHTESEVEFHRPVSDAETGGPLRGPHTIPPYGVLVVRV